MRMSNPPNSNSVLSIKSSILSCSAISNFLTLTFGYFFFNSSNFSDLVPVPITLPPNEENFLTNSLPIPPVAPVTRIFLFLKLIIFLIIYYFNGIYISYFNSFVNFFYKT